MIYNATERVKEAWAYYDKLLDAKLDNIAKLAGVDRDKLIKINPAEFIEKSQYMTIEGYEYKKIGEWIAATKTPETYLISPLDDDERTANQISYKEKIDTVRIRGGKCQCIPLPNIVAQEFFRKNHRQSLPRLTTRWVTFGLLYGNELVGAMCYDKTEGAVRGAKEDYELLRLAFKHSVSIAGGASKLEKHCEEALAAIGETRVFSYSNATINEGRVYEALGFAKGKVDGGQPFVIMPDHRILRLIELHPYSTDKALAERQCIKTHIGGNRLWYKDIGPAKVDSNEEEA